MPIELGFGRELTPEEEEAFDKMGSVPTSANTWRLDRFYLLEQALAEAGATDDMFPEWQEERERLRAYLRGLGYDLPRAPINPPANVELTLTHMDRVWWVTSNLNGLQIYNGQRGGIRVYDGQDNLGDLPLPVQQGILSYWSQMEETRGFLVPDVGQNTATWHHGSESMTLRWDQLDAVEVTPLEGSPYTFTIGQEQPDDVVWYFWYNAAVGAALASEVRREFDGGPLWIIRVLPSGRVWYEHGGNYLAHSGEDDPVPEEVLRVAQSLFREHAALRDRARLPPVEVTLVQSANPPAPLAFGVHNAEGNFAPKLEIWTDHFVVDGVRVEVEHPAEARMVLDSFLVTSAEARHGDPQYFMSQERKGNPTLWDHLEQNDPEE